MNALVLYRRWRPQRFADVVGQDAAVQTLRQAVRQGRVAHAYLFAGPRGTGKTSTARVLAKALNCDSLAPGAPESAQAQGEPDNTCPSCQAVNEGRALDLIEMDAASNRGIGDVRSLQERVFGAGPAAGRCKVYIMDEVHMLTQPAFNALLKTLEEPAPWAYFILCTTEPHDVLPTIISRCQRFDFRRVPPAEVAGRLEAICRAEGIEWEPGALYAIARASGGSLRDACNTLEQASLSYGGRVTLAGVQGLLGLGHNPHALEVARHALAGDLPAGLAAISGAGSEGLEPQVLHRQVVERLRAVLLSKSGVEEPSDDSPEVREATDAMAEAAPWETLLRAVAAFGRANTRMGDGPSTFPLEMALLEVVSPQAARPEGRTQAAAAPPRPVPVPPAARPQAQASAPAPSVRPQAAPSPPAPSAAPPAAAQQAGAAAALPEGAVPLSDAQWDAIVRPLKRSKPGKYNLGSLLLDCRSRYLEGSTLVLVYRSESNKERLQVELEHPPSRRAMEEALAGALGGPYELRLVVSGGQGGSRGAPSGHLVRAAVAMGARIIQDERVGR